MQRTLGKIKGQNKLDDKYEPKALRKIRWQQFISELEKNKIGSELPIFYPQVENVCSPNLLKITIRKNKSV